MSQQPPQWSPQAVQIFTVARQMGDPQSQFAYLNQACGANAQLRWEVDWLLQWDRSQHLPAGAVAPISAAPMPIAQTPGPQMSTLYSLSPPQQIAATTVARPSRRWVWITAIASIIVLFTAFLGLFAYGAYSGVRNMQFDREASRIESGAYARFQQGDYDGAAREYERLVEMRKRQYGENHSKVSETIVDAASCWYYAREFGTAANLYEKAYQLDLKRVGPKDKATLQNQDSWAIALSEADDYIKAMEIFSQALAIRKDLLGPNHEDTAESMTHVGDCQLAMGQSAVALQSYEPAYETQTKRHTAFHEGAMRTMHSMLDCYDDLGRYDDARKLLTRVYDSLKKIHGFDGAETTRIRELLCARLDKDQDWEALLNLRQEHVDDLVAKLGANEPQTVSAKETLARTLVKRGEADKGIALLLECRDKLKAAQGDEGAEFIACLHHLADAYKTAKSPEKGVALFQELFEERKQKLGPRSPASLEVASQIGLRKILADDNAGGEADMEKALAGAIEALGLQHETSQRIATELADHYQSTRFFAKEVEIRRRLAQHQQKAAGLEDPTTRERLDSQANAELEAGNTDAAIDIYRRLFDFETNRTGATGGSTLYKARSLIRSYMRSNQRQKAVDFCDELLSKLHRSTGVDYATSWNATDLGMLISRIGDPARACDAFEMATESRPKYNYDSSEGFERKFVLWPAQAAAAKRSEQAIAKINAKLEDIKKTAGADFFLARSLRIQKGMHAEASGKLAEAEQAFRELETQLQGKSIGWHSQALLLLGGNLRRQGKFDEAEATLRKSLALKEMVHRRDIDPDPDMEITDAADVELELALCQIAQSKLPEAESALLAINNAKSKLTYHEERFWDARCRAQALQQLIEVQTKLGKTDDIEKWKAALQSLESTYPGVGKV